MVPLRDNAYEKRNYVKHCHNTVVMVSCKMRETEELCTTGDI